MNKPRIVNSITGETIKEVKNLGWMLRNWRIISGFTVKENTDSHYDAILIAHTDDGREFITDYASKTILREFLFHQHKSIFDGLTVSWFGSIEKI